ncbi:MAG: hypothetical protein NT062_12355 [Proteobacteria bacterium]|nr:hypothetical protein [Pseudomonadota bacterium]
MIPRLAKYRRAASACSGNANSASRPSGPHTTPRSDVSASVANGGSWSTSSGAAIPNIRIRFGRGSVDVHHIGSIVAASITTLHSSRTSRAPPCCHVSVSSTKPPGIASLPMLGGIARRITRMPVRPASAIGAMITATGIGFAQTIVVQLAHVRG